LEQATTKPFTEVDIHFRLVGSAVAEVVFTIVAGAM
jgi:hypothetical protein